MGSDAESYLDAIREVGPDAEQLELTYQRAARAGDAEAFADAIEAGYAETPDSHPDDRPSAHTRQRPER
jgi:hypothetical protein